MRSPLSPNYSFKGNASAYHFQASFRATRPLTSGVRPMNFLAGFKRRLKGKDRAWWELFFVSFDDFGVVVTERKVSGDPEVSFVVWEEIRYVCFEDGGLGSDVF